jgi:hypothetical protein
VAQSKVEFRYMRKPHEWEWFRSRNNITMTQDTRGFVALMNGQPAAACAINHYHGYSVEIHQVILRPIVIRHGWLEEVSREMFGDNVLSIYSFVFSSLPKVIKFNEHLGMKVQGRIPDANGPGDDYIVMSGIRKDCRFLEENKDGCP